MDLHPSPKLNEWGKKNAKDDHSQIIKMKYICFQIKLLICRNFKGEKSDKDKSAIHQHRPSSYLLRNIFT